MDASQLHIEPASSVPIYRQIVAQVQRMTAGGQLPPGELLPSVRDVAATHAVNPMTVSKAYSQLEAEGIVERLRGKGMAVCAPTRAAQSLKQRWEWLDPQLDALARQAQELELPTEDVLRRLKLKLED